MLPQFKSRKLDQNLYPQGYFLLRSVHREFDIDSITSGHPQINDKGRKVLVAREIARKINDMRDFSKPGTRPARAGELLAMGLLTDVFRYVMTLYCEDFHKGVLDRGLMWTRLRTETRVVELPIMQFIQLYPPKPVLENSLSEKAFLEQHHGGLHNREIALRDLILLGLSMENPALRHYRILFDDAELRSKTPSTTLLQHIDTYFNTQPPFPDYNFTLLELLREPMRQCPDDIEGQLNFIRERWKQILPDELLEMLQLAHGVLREERVMRGMGTGPNLAVPEFSSYPEYEAFSEDRDWMPNVVLMAKTVYVWLDQLSKKYNRHIYRLDQIPDEELDRLARWGFTGLWLIGLWERSKSSQIIKERMGNPEAAASAYSLYDYVIAHDLGGEEALMNLKERAMRRGIRLASDMVPNHVGIFSRWIVEHPDWFIQLRHVPYPQYSFNGPDLSQDDRVGIYIEDGYWNHSDAAVVFKRVDKWTGDTRYIYHGNDGTSMPWNDTAQLNYLINDVREAVIQTILHVARQFQIIRFDAAMTLAKKHYQRLWYPAPGDGGGIPSRAEHGMTRPDFDHCFPKEFWREVVDRIARELPDTLLLAEAFWLMEGYFVRTLGMHRVYNSAFMNMLKMEENGKFRQSVKNVLEFSPAILQRYVNFMNNPDEDTAYAQFGDGDKYFGVCVLLSTMPGLPMYGHGQIEGYHEKYGMEYRRAYYDEIPNEPLIARHEYEIFPLLQKRWLFSGATHFALFDFVTPEGWVNENVIAYSNFGGGERSIILYNNSFTSTRGVIHTSTAVNEGTAEAKRLRRHNLASALKLNTMSNCYYIIRDTRSGLEYLHHAVQMTEEGLHMELQGYQYAVFLDWREVYDHDLSWGRLHGKLAGAGVQSVSEAYQEMHLADVLEPLRGFINGAMLQLLADHMGDTKESRPFQIAFDEYYKAICEKVQSKCNVQMIMDNVQDELALLFDFDAFVKSLALDAELLKYIHMHLDDSKPSSQKPVGVKKEALLDLKKWRVPLVWILLRHMGELVASEEDTEQCDSEEVSATKQTTKPVVLETEPVWKTLQADMTSAAWMHEWYMLKPMVYAFDQLYPDMEQAESDARLVRICTGHMPHLLALQDEVWGPVLDHIFRDADVLHYLRANHYQGKLWINKERLEHMMFMLFLCATLSMHKNRKEAPDLLNTCLENIMAILETAEVVSYDLDMLLSYLK